MISKFSFKSRSLTPRGIALICGALLAFFALVEVGYSADTSEATTIAQTPVVNPAAPEARHADEGTVLARSAALDLAGAFSNDGYKIRDGGVSAQLKPGESQVVLLNLFVGNEYWFVAAGEATSRKVDVTVYDNQGVEVSGTSFSDNANGARAASGYIAPVSGQYLVRMRLIDGEPGTVFLLYCYK